MSSLLGFVWLDGWIDGWVDGWWAVCVVLVLVLVWCGVQLFFWEGGKGEEM